MGFFSKWGQIGWQILHVEDLMESGARLMKSNTLTRRLDVWGISPCKTLVLLAVSSNIDLFNEQMPSPSRH
jgi:hypothetical protein